MNKLVHYITAMFMVFFSQPFLLRSKWLHHHASDVISMTFIVMLKYLLHKQFLEEPSKYLFFLFVKVV